MLAGATPQVIRLLKAPSLGTVGSLTRGLQIVIKPEEDVSTLLVHVSQCLPKSSKIA